MSLGKLVRTHVVDGVGVELVVLVSRTQ
jgi:hypothetical protein